MGKKAPGRTCFQKIEHLVLCCQPLEGLPRGCRTECRWWGVRGQETLQQVGREVSPRCPALKALLVSRGRWSY